MSTPPPAKRPRTASSGISSSPKPVEILQPPPPPVPIEPRSILNTIPPPVVSPPNPRKRPLSKSPAVEQRPPLNLKPPPSNIPIAESSSAASVSIPALLSADSSERPRKARTNTPWTAAEEQRLKQMRDTGNIWSEIAKAFPNRTEGSVKKHWYKDMHYAEFAEDETKALLEAIKEYEANKWKVIGQKLGKPAKACEQFAKDHFKNM